jgi:hypothetical protein
MLDYKDFQDRMRDIVDYMSYWDPEAFDDFRFAALDQWAESTRQRLDELKRPHLVLDKTRIIIDSVGGSEVSNRYEPKFYPRNLPGEDIDLEASEGVGELYRWGRQTCDAEHQESMMFRDTAICGVGCTDTFMDYTDSQDGNGIIRTVRVPVFQVAWDPTSQDANFADANFFVRDKWIPEKEFIAKYPDFAGVYNEKGDIHESRVLQRAWSRLTNRDNNRYAGSRSFQYFDPKHRHVHVWEYQWRELRPVTRIMIPNAMGQYDDMVVERHEAESIIEEAMQANEALQTMAQESGVEVAREVKWHHFEKYFYYRSILAGKEILEEVDEPLQDFTLKFTTGFEDFSRGDKKYYFGLMKPMRDPQKYVNSFFSAAIHKWSTSPKGAFLHEPNFFEDEDEARKQFAQPNPVLRTAHGALSGTAKDKYRIIENHNSFSGSEPLFNFANNAISEASGVNPAYTAGLAGDVRRAATSAIELVQQGNLTTLAPLFDGLRRYRKAHAGLFMSFVREYMNDDQIIRVLGPEKAHMVQLTKDELVRQYDIVVSDGPSSPTQQHQVMQHLVQTDLLGRLIDTQLWPAEGWKYLGLPSDLGTQIMNRQQMMEQMMMQQQAPPAGEGGEPIPE